MKKVNIAILGFGTVGYGVYRIASENCADIMHRENLELNVKRILVRDFVNEPNYSKADASLFTTSIQDILNDDDISIVIECMGGVEPARTFILSVLHSGKTLVTSNKEVFSKYWQEFEAAAKKTSAGLYHEATVGGGIPIIRTITDSMQGNNITNIMGIINGTTNFILSKMAKEGVSFKSALTQAQELGFAEANPAADVEGFDATYKLSILASMAFHAHIPIEAIYREGITNITSEDMRMANDLGYDIKLLAIGKKHGKSIEVRVHPTMIPKDHPLAAVRDSFNAIFLNGHAVGEIMLYGRGAGQMPTASAVMSDVIYACHAKKHRYMTFENIKGMSDEISLVTDWESVYCLRLIVTDKPGVLSNICGLFAKHGVSLKTVIQLGDGTSDAPITFITHKAQELSVQAAIKEISALDVVVKFESLIRVEQ